MNLLAHFWLADHTDTSAAGQLLGDHVKGRLKDARLDPAIREGVRLHRRIDAYCDDHRVHRTLRGHFAPPLRRYAGIIVDIGLDHALARGWPGFSDEPLAQFAARMAAQVAREWPTDAPVAAPPRRGLARTLTGYADADGIERALRSVGGRLRRTNPLSDALPALMAEYADFERNLPDLLHALERHVERA